MANLTGLEPVGASQSPHLHPTRIMIVLRWLSLFSTQKGLRRPPARVKSSTRSALLALWLENTLQIQQKAVLLTQRASPTMLTGSLAVI